MDLGFRMHAERTPNPNSIKWVLGQTVADVVASASFSKGVTPEISPLAAAILEIDGTEGVTLGPNFVTVSKAEGVEWTDLAAPIVAAIKAWAASGESAFGPAFEPPAKEDDDVVTARIRTILERDVRPYVEQDGGEIVFAGYHDGIVEVILQGACAGCPSSTITLKMGIEARLKEEIPEVRSVVAL
ncbi:MAG TPA: NifU family protein [Deltaproteobacteria bacterium]|nr:NifU family protein [Deltaproteobacteria bacterium]